MKKQALLARVSEADLRLLRVFMAIAEAGGLSAAELRLNITRSVISRHLKELEGRLGVKLCERGRSGFALSPEGESVLGAARRLLAQLDSFRSEVAALHATLRGELHLAVFDKFITNPACKIAPALATLRAEAPAVSVHLHVASTVAMEKGLLDGRYALGVQPFHRPSASFDTTTLFSEEMSLYCAEHHPLAARATPAPEAQVRQAEFVGLGYHSRNMETFWRFGLRPAARAFDQEGTLALIASGAYVGFLPDHYAQAIAPSIRLVRLLPAVFHYQCEWGVITARTPAPGRLALHFQALLRQAHGLSPAAPALAPP